MQFRSRKKAGKAVRYPIQPRKKSSYATKPSLSSRMNVHSDVRTMHRKDDPKDPMDHTREHNLYKKQLVHEADKTDIRETVKANKRQEKIIQKEEKQQEKKENQQDDEIRQDAGVIDGNDNRDY